MGAALLSQSSGQQPPRSLRSAGVKRPPSDYELLKEIWERYRAEFQQTRPITQTGILLPIDIPAIAAALGTDADSVFGRLYYHLDPIYGEAPRADGSPQKVLFTPLANDEPNCINLPLLEAVLAGLWQERNRQLWAVWASAISVAVALAALIVSIIVAVSLSAARAAGHRLQKSGALVPAAEAGSRLGPCHQILQPMRSSQLPPRASMGRVRGHRGLPAPSLTASPKLYRAVCFLYLELAGSTPALWPPWGRPRTERSARLIEEARRRGISERTLREAKRLCLVDDTREGWGRGSTCWWLPPRREFVRWAPKAEVKQSLREERALQRGKRLKARWSARPEPPRKPGKKRWERSEAELSWLDRLVAQSAHERVVSAAPAAPPG